LRNAAPYFLAAAAATVLARVARREFAFAVSGRKELLALVSLTTLFVIYGAAFYREMRDYFTAWRTKRVVAE
jgi:hypothetical protein